MRLLVPALAALLLSVAPAALAKRAATPKVTFAGWTVYDAAGTSHKAKPGRTLTRCTHPTELLARGPVHGAVKHQSYLETWYRNGRRTDRFTISWNGRGTYADSWSLTDAAGFANGTWTIKLTRKGKLIGKESVTLKCA